MICGHCKMTDTHYDHVVQCWQEEKEDAARRAIGVPTTAEKIEAPAALLVDGEVDFAAEIASQRRAARATSTWQKVTEAGMYRVGDDVFKVQLNQLGTHLYAKRLVVETDTDQDGRTFVLSSAFAYAAGALQSLEASDRMTDEDAAAFGRLYGVCCVCGARLTNEASIAAGIGPYCAGKL